MIKTEFKTKDIEAKYRKRISRLKDMRSSYAKVAIFLDRWVQSNIKTQGGNVGGWTPFRYGGRVVSKKKGKAQSIKGGKYINPSAKLLQLTGRLKSSFLPFSSRNNAGVGSKLPYSKNHNEGIGNTARRRILPKIGEVIGKARDILKKSVRGKIK